MSRGEPAGAIGERLLAAREARARLIDRMAARAPRSGARSVIVASTGVPGPHKTPPGLNALFASALTAVRASVPRAMSVAACEDAAGPVFAWLAPWTAQAVKPLLVVIEERLPGGRLIDLDVCGGDGRPIGRRELGLSPRPCLLCPEPAVDCARLGRHGSDELAAAAGALLSGNAPPAAAPEDLSRDGPPFVPRALARALAAAALTELRLTPKPGLVDLLDTGSHSDLTFDSMERSARLLPCYLDGLITARLAGANLHSLVEIGQRAESRMLDAAGTNTHKGLIFLAGLLVLASCDGARTTAGLREGIASTAAAFFRRAGSAPTRGQQAAAGRGPWRPGGIAGETLAGLPSVFDDALPALDAVAVRTGDLQTAAHAAMARLMQRVDDTTSVRRCGAGGLARIRRDGQALQALIDQGADHLTALARWNEEYRREGLTMGGVADLLAVTLALAFARDPGHPFAIAECVGGDSADSRQLTADS